MRGVLLAGWPRPTTSGKQSGLSASATDHKVNINYVFHKEIYYTKSQPFLHSCIALTGIQLLKGNADTPELKMRGIVTIYSDTRLDLFHIFSSDFSVTCQSVVTFSFTVSFKNHSMRKKERGRRKNIIA